MIEAIRTFFGKSRGEHGERRTVVQEGLVWRCSNCYLIFLTKSAGDDHKCQRNILPNNFFGLFAYIYCHWNF